MQREDGYVHTPTLIAARHHQDALALADRFHFETYNLGHLITAGVRHYEVTGSTTLLDVARGAARFLENLAANEPVELARSAICPSHYMAVIDLYRATNDEQYLRLAEAFVRVRDDFQGGDDNQDRLPVRDQRVVAGHAVRANYLYAGLADIVAETGDAELQGVLEDLWSDVVDTKLYVTGGCGALYDGASPDGDPWQEEISRIHQAYGRAYQLPHTTAHAESCANIGMILWSERMLALTGDARYADVIEQIAYNALLAGISLDGSRYFYTNALRQVRDLPYPLRMPGDTGQHPVPAPPASDARLRETYLSCFCCPPNIARTLARFHERAASVSSDGLYIHQYGGSSIRFALPDGRSLALREFSDYPWDGRIEFTVRRSRQWRDAPAPSRAGLVEGRRAHGQRRADGDRGPGRLRRDRSRMADGRRPGARPADAGANAARPPPRRGGDEPGRGAARTGRLRGREHRPARRGSPRAGGAAARGDDETRRGRARRRAHRRARGRDRGAATPPPRPCTTMWRPRRWARHPSGSSPTSRGATAAPRRCRYGCRWSGDRFGLRRCF